MHHNFSPLNSSQPSFQNTQFSLFQPPKSKTQDSNHSSAQTSDKEKDLHDDHIKPLQENGHARFCDAAHLEFKKKNYSIAYEMCIKAVENASHCEKCVGLYLQLYEIILPRRLPLLDTLLKRYQKGPIQDIETYLTLKKVFYFLTKIKKTQNLDWHYLDLLDDLQRGGAEFSHISIFSQNQDNRTIVARNDIKKGETILFVPKSKMILLENARESAIVKKVKRQRVFLKSQKHCELTIFLLEQVEKRQHSDYWFYIKHLPTSFDTFPINFKPHELNYLKGSPFLELIQAKISDIKSDYESICKICPQFQRFSLEDFKKYRLIVSSRVFGIEIGVVRTDALVPLADMLNHNIPKKTSWFYSVHDEGFMIKSAGKIEKGEQIYDSYGMKCNSRYLLNYGFVMPENCMNEVVLLFLCFQTMKIPFECEEEDRVSIYRLVSIKVTPNIESREFEELLSITRHSVMQLEEDSREMDEIEKINKTPFTSVDVELKVWQKLQKLVQAQVQSYPTTLKQDMKLLMSKDLSTNYFNCLILRKGEKQIYGFYLTMAKKMVRFFRSSMGERAREQVKEYESYLKKLNFS